ncbi:ThiF family adenylyltransferase [Duganella sp. CT11-25]|uniref:ThiF family adenylyltransferase n=1 Tax=unclassified Duganella TaxID=2636909 RepID=UPI0039AF2D82
MTEYYDFPSAVPVEPADLHLERAGQVLRAVLRDEDCAFIECSRSEDGRYELIVVDLQTHGIPTRSRVDIQFSERVAFVVPQDSKQYVAAQMLRIEFPTLLHQNQTRPGSPRELCLHYEPRATVLRTWTAQRFLRRVKWWLASTASGTLHAADQAPETLFFDSNDELVAPANFDELVADGCKFEIAISEKHVGGGNTYILSETSELATGAPEPIQIVLPPVEHGYIQDMPETMADLVSLFSSRGVDLLALLREKIASRLTGQVARQPFGGTYVIFVLHTPMRLSAAVAATQTLHHAFMVFEPFLEVGRKIGALVLHRGTYVCETALAGQVPVLDGLDEMLLAQFSFLRKNEFKDFRHQSGSDDDGVKSVLVGAGALGSSLLNLWARSGWGSWTVIDKDHIKPHNLTRHVATDAEIGHGKSLVATDAAKAVTRDPARFTPIQADATLFGAADVASALAGTSLIIDASTTLDYPRLASDDATLPRHMSVFITPSGRSSVLLAESADRSISLRTIEAQYYRAIIKEAWGEHHLYGNLGTFWTGASCRDISFRLPLAQVQLHAANLAQMVIKTAKTADAKIAVWDRNTDTGDVYSHAVHAFKETRKEIGDFTIFLDEGLEQELRAMRVASLPNETGGILLGYHDLTLKRIVLVKACPPPPDSVGTPTSFVRGTQGVAALLKDVESRTAAIVGYVGDWHSHPRGYSANASQDDVVQLVGLARSMLEDGLPALQLIVGEADINVYLATTL